MTPSPALAARVHRDPLARLSTNVAGLALWALLLFALWTWNDYLGLTVLSDDRQFHTLSLVYGLHNPTEPLWGYLAPLIGQTFPEEPFEAASLLTVLLLVAGMALNGWRLWAIVLLAFSPGVTYFLTNALRQGLALGLLLTLIGLTRSRRRPFASPWVIVLAASPVIFVHNAIAIAVVFILWMRWLALHAQQGRSSQKLQMLLAVGSVGVLGFGFARGGVGGTAMALFTAQALMLFGSFFLRSLRRPVVPLLAACVMAIAAGFLFTTTGLRVVTMISLLAPVVMRGRWAMAAPILGCWAYPLFLLAFGFDTGNLAPGL